MDNYINHAHLLRNGDNKMSDKEFKINELRDKIEKLKVLRDAYQLMEDGIKKK